MKTQSAIPHRFVNSPLAIGALPRLLAIGLLCLSIPRAQASFPNGVNHTDLTSIAAAPGGGYWIQVDGGLDNDENGGSRTIAINGARQFPSVPYRGSIASVPGREDYWIVTNNGRIFAVPGGTLCGGYLSNCSGYSYTDATDTIMGAAASPDAKGLWAVDRQGRVWTAGTTVSYGDVTGDSNFPTGIVATPSGLGYYIVLADGGVYSFGDAVFYGSTGGNKPGGHEATGLALSVDMHGKVNGYWMVFDDGGVYSFGDAPFLGSTGGNDGGSPVTGIAASGHNLRHRSNYGPSYAWVHFNAYVEHSATLPRVTIASSASGLVWGVSTTGTPANILLTTLSGSRCSFAPNLACSQVWDIWPTSEDGDIVQLVNVYSGLCADVSSNPVNSAYLIQYPCKGKTENWDNQRFIVRTYSSGRVDFSPVNSNYRVCGVANNELGLCLAVSELWVLSDAP